MSASPEALRAIRTVARQLGELRERVVFVGGVVRGLLLSDPAVEGSRATKDVDLITAGITTLAAYYRQISARLQQQGFREDTSEGAPLCRWKLGELLVDVMPSDAAVLGFTNRWYAHAIETATTEIVSEPGSDELAIRLLTAPCFLATKLEAFAHRGGGDYLASHDLEDLLALVDGRPALVEEVEREPLELRRWIADELTRHLAAGLSDAIPAHLAGDEASQGRLPLVSCAIERLRRVPRPVVLGEVVSSTHAGQPGANGPLDLGPWRYQIQALERRQARTARDHVVVRARVTLLGRTAGTVGDGRNVLLEDARGLRFPPLYKLVVQELAKLGLPETGDQAVAQEPFETCWVYEVPREVRGLRLLLPFDQHELLLRNESTP